MTGKDLVAVNEQVQLKALKNYYERWEDKSERCEHLFFNPGLIRIEIYARGGLRDVRGIEPKNLRKNKSKQRAIFCLILSPFLTKRFI